MKKYSNIFVATAVVFVIVGAPLISYIYLREGLAFRIDAIEYLKQNEEELTLTKIVSENFTLKKNFVNVLFKHSKLSDAFVARVYDKFKGHKQFQLIEYGPDISMNTIKENHNQQNVSTNLINYDMVLVDTALQVRSTYMNNPEEFASFIQHLSVLLPVETSKKIVLERQKDE